MRKFVNFLKFVFVLTMGFYSPLSFAGDHGGVNGGGGGDGIETTFEMARAISISTLQKLSPSTALPRGINIADYQWLLSHQKEIQKELQEVAFLWPETTDQSTCAYTLYQKKAPITFSLKQCKVGTNTLSLAVSTLIHEIAHHYGVNAHQIAARLGMAFDQMRINLESEHIEICDRASKNVFFQPVVIRGNWLQSSYNPRHTRGLAQPQIDAALEHLHFEHDVSVASRLPDIGACAQSVGKLKWQQDEFLYAWIEFLSFPYLLIFDRVGGKIPLHRIEGNFLFNYDSNRVEMVLGAHEPGFTSRMFGGEYKKISD